MDLLKIIELLEEAYPETVMITRELSSYEQGKLHGSIEIKRYINKLITEKED